MSKSDGMHVWNIHKYILSIPCGAFLIEEVWIEQKIPLEVVTVQGVRGYPFE